jgi:hypothetical protein
VSWTMLAQSIQCAARRRAAERVLTQHECYPLCGILWTVN